MAKKLEFYGSLSEVKYTYKAKGKRKAETKLRWRVDIEHRQANGTYKKEPSQTFKIHRLAESYLNTQRDLYDKNADAYHLRNITLSEFAKKYYIPELHRRLKNNPKDEIARVNHAVNYFGADYKLSKLRRIQLDQYRNDLINGVRSNRTVDSYLVRITNLLTYAHTLDLIEPVSFKGLFLRGYNRRKRTIDLKSFFRMLDICNVEYNPHQDRKHLKLFLIGLHETAARSSELKQVRVKDIDLKKRIIRIWEGKRSKATEPEQRASYVSDLLFAALKESKVLDTLDKEKLVFGEQQSYQTAFESVRALAGIDNGFVLRDLRRTGITNMVRAGLKLEEIKKLVGHKANSKLTEEVYLAFQEEHIAEMNQPYERYMKGEIAKLANA